MMVHQTFALEVVGENVGLWVIYRQAVLGGHPQTAVGILDDTLDTTEGQTVFCGQGFKMSALVCIILYQSVQAIAIAAQPERAVTGLTERRDLVDDA